MAKVMISIPDQLLALIDQHVEAAHETRSGFLQRVAKRELEGAARHERAEIERLLNEIQPLDFGGVNATQLVREDRESH